MAPGSPAVTDADPMLRPDDPVRVFAREWAAEVEGTSFVPMEPDELSDYLVEVTSEVVAAVSADPPRTYTGATIGRRLVAEHFTGPSTLERTLVLLVERLPELLGADVAPAVRALAGELAGGYATTLRDRTLDEQEAIRRAVLTARHQTELALQASEARFRAMFYEAAIGIGLADLTGRIVEVNPALQEMFGYGLEEFRDLTVSDLVHPDDAPAVWELYERLVVGEIDNFRVEKRFFRADGEEIVVHLTLSLVRDERGVPSYRVAMLEDVTHRRQLQSHLEYQAFHDPLTSLPNRALFSDRLDRLFAATPSTSTRRVGLLYLDLDGFKTFNDSLGHEVGDLLLQAVSRRFAAGVGQEGLVARMGGDEFVVLVEDTAGVDQLADLADRVLAELVEPFDIAGHQLTVSASAGIVERPVAGTDAGDLLRAADITLYSAKSDGRGRWALHDPTRDAAETTRFTLSAAMPAAIAREEFFLHYQPLVAMEDHRLRGVESLVRWKHPSLGVLGPNRFIPLAEETGVIVGLGSWVLRRSCSDAAAWYAEMGEDAPFVSVNVAPRQLHEPGFVDEVAEVLATTGLPPGKLHLELTERALTSDEGAPLKALDALRAMGARIAIDDFGTGYSNLSYLRRLPIDVLKLDGSFGEGLRDPDAGDPVDEQIVGTLVALGHALGLSVTAEGVETAAQAARMRRLGCDDGQGWLYAPAMPADAVGVLLHRSDLAWPAPTEEPGGACGGERG